MPAWVEGKDDYDDSDSSDVKAAGAARVVR